MKRMYGAVAQGNSIRQKETPARPWEQPEARNGRNAATEGVDEHLSDLGKYLKGKLQAVMAYLSSGKEDEQTA
ncbi:MAG TPA: hypothetical protein PKV72_01720 [Candidatus Peribacteria bacterium]|nr:hypothetical protein [Candidatus Peribacteria bacterium]